MSRIVEIQRIIGDHRLVFCGNCRTGFWKNSHIVFQGGGGHRKHNRMNSDPYISNHIRIIILEF